MDGKKQSPVTAADLKKDGYKAQYGVIVICADAIHQRMVFERLRVLNLGVGLKVVCV